tara:strand:- start:851 stop:2005 length:1155 start_codon:yes stop_codon:yes gene_type:complete
MDNFKFLNAIPGSQYMSKVIMVLIPIVILYYFYKKLKEVEFKYRILLREVINAKSTKIIKRDLIPYPKMGMEYSLMFWMRLTDYDYKKGKFKNVLYIGDTGSKCQPGIWIDSEKNDLILRFKTNEKIRNYKKINGRAYRSLGTKQARDHYIIEFGEQGTTLPSGKKITTVRQMKNYVRNVNSSKNNCSSDIIVSQSSFVVLAEKDPGEDENLQRIFYYKKRVKGDRLEQRNFESYGNKKFYYYTFELEKEEASLNPEHKNAVHNHDGLGTIINNIPINKWMHIALVVHEQSVQVFIDSRMVKNIPFSNSIVLNRGNLNISSNGGFAGGLARVIFYGLPLSYMDILKQYVRGPNAWDFDLQKMLGLGVDVGAGNKNKENDKKDCK